MKQLLKRINLIKRYFFKNDQFPYPTEDLETIVEKSNNKKLILQSIKQELFKYWDYIASLALGGILNHISDEEKREDVKGELVEQNLLFLQDIDMEEYEGLNNIYIVFETTKSMLIDLIDDYENNTL